MVSLYPAHLRSFPVTMPNMVLVIVPHSIYSYIRPIRSANWSGWTYIIREVFADITDVNLTVDIRKDLPNGGHYCILQYLPEDLQYRRIRRSTNCTYTPA